MFDQRKDHGQTLVELALVLPCFCLGIFMAVQLMCYCHNMVELQRMAQVMIDRVSCENYTGQKKYKRFESLWGEYTNPRASFSNVQFVPFLPFKGKSTLKEPGRFIRVNVHSDLIPGEGFTSVLSRVSQQAFAETYLEPPIPSEK